MSRTSKLNINDWSGIRRGAAGLTLAALLLSCGPQETAEEAPAAEPAAGGEQVVNVYSSRHYDTDQELYDTFEQQTGIKVNVIEGDSAALLERLRREGDRSPADLFLTVDAGRLHQAEQEGIFQGFGIGHGFQGHMLGKMPAGFNHLKKRIRLTLPGGYGQFFQEHDHASQIRCFAGAEFTDEFGKALQQLRDIAQNKIFIHSFILQKELGHTPICRKVPAPES